MIGISRRASARWGLALALGLSLTPSVSRGGQMAEAVPGMIEAVGDFSAAANPDAAGLERALLPLRSADLNDSETRADLAPLLEKVQSLAQGLIDERDSADLTPKQTFSRAVKLRALFPGDAKTRPGVLTPYLGKGQAARVAKKYARYHKRLDADRRRLLADMTAALVLGALKPADAIKTNPKRKTPLKARSKFPPAIQGLETGARGFRSVGNAPPLPRAKLYRKLLAEERIPDNLKKAGYVGDWSAIDFFKPERIVKPKTEAEIRAALKDARKRKLKVQMAGTRHSMGGQAMQDGGVFLDMNDYRGAVFHYDTQSVTVKSGTNWLDLQNYLQRYGRTVQVKQASSVFSIGGSISSNIHGEDFRFGTIGNTVRALKIMLADGQIVTASRTVNSELFSHVIGGYGLFGVILEAELDTAPDEKYLQKFQVMPAADLPRFVKEELLPNPNNHFFLTELSIMPGSFIEQALVMTWEKVTKEGDQIPAFTPADQSKLHVLLEKIPYVMAMRTTRIGKAVLWFLEKYIQPLMMAKYVSRNDALTLDYDMNRVPALKDSQVLQEIFVPIDKYNETLPKVRALAKKYQAHVGGDVDAVYSSSRFVKKDTLTALPFAKDDDLSLVIFRDQKLTPLTAAQMEMFYREIGDIAIGAGGTFYLTYQLPYTRRQMRAAYPGMDKFFEVKRKYDPGELFENSLYKKFGRPPAVEEPLAAAPVGAPSLGAEIKNIVVLMLENRSFDNLFGYLKELNPEIDGLSGTASNPVDPADLSKGVVRGSRGARFFGEANPGHEPDRVHRQMYGTPSGRYFAHPLMNGFFADYLSQQPKDWTPEQRQKEAAHIMDGFAPEQIPVFATLAKYFVVAIRWFSSAPTSTFPNRAIFQTGTANGHLHSASAIRDPEFWAAFLHDMYDARTIYDNLAAAGRRWKIYYHDIIWSFLVPGVRRYPENLAKFKRFAKDVANNTLPAFSFIEPAYINTPYHKANDADAPHDVREAERLVADVYNALRSNEKVWKKTLLVITTDEHGGYYDHVPPPKTVNPDGKNSAAPKFDFTRLGVRVPALLISPWLPKGVVDHTVYDHTSILKFAENRFGLPPLTERDANANTFDHMFTLSKPRDDTPLKITPPTSGSEKNTDPRLYDPSEPQGWKAVLGAFAMGTGMRAFYYVKYSPWILARKAKRFTDWVVGR